MGKHDRCSYERFENEIRSIRSGGKNENYQNTADRFVRVRHATGKIFR